MRRVGRIGIWVVVLIVLSAAGWLIWTEYRTGSRIEAAEAALATDDPAAALALLEKPLTNRAESGRVQFLAARAYRRTGNLVMARQHLTKAKSLGWIEEAIDLETGLLQAQTSSLTPAYELYLRKCMDETHPDAALVAEVLAPLDFSELRLKEALYAVEIWLKKQPNSAKAWALSAAIQDRFRNRAAALDAYGKAVELAPKDPAYGLALAKQLLAMKEPPEKAATILEQLDREGRGDTTLRITLAYCRIEQGRLDDARVILEGVLRTEPSTAQAVYLLGRIEMMQNRPDLALPHFRKAVELAPFETEMLYALWQALKDTNAAMEATAVRERWERSSAELGRLAELSREVARDPTKAESRYAAGEICLRNGLEKEGAQWLLSAVKVQPDHAASHRLLAEHYARVGRSDLAARHKALAGKPTP